MNPIYGLNVLYSKLSNSFKIIFISIVFPYFLVKIYRKINDRKVIELKAFKDKVVVITGASSGLGKAMAQVFYRSGARLILSSRRTDELQNVKNWLIRDFNTSDDCFEPQVLRLDLSELNGIELYAKEALSYYGRVDVLVNNAGISYRGKAVDTCLEVDHKLMVVNYLGQLAVIKAFLRPMIERNSGQIVVIGSIQSQLALPYRSAYAASKHALQAFCDSLRAELSDTKISVCVINPGYIRTDLSINAITSSGARYGLMDATTAEGMAPEEAAKLIVMSVMKNDKQLILSPLLPKIAIWIRFMFPTIYFHLMNRRAKREKKSSLD